MTEAQLQTVCIDLAHVYGWRLAHFRPAMTKRGEWRTPVSGDGKGFPDFLLLKPNKIVAAELKATGGKATQDQLDWLLAFRSAGVPAYIWTPKEWADGSILQVLQG
jgi:hypothetical protein